jgi:hypothetical protein
LVNSWLMRCRAMQRFDSGVRRAKAALSVSPFDKPKKGRVAVKVINHRGDEVMKVFRGLMASRALIFQLLADFHKDVAVVAACGDHEGTAGALRSVVSVLALGLAVLGNHSPTECSKQGRRPSQWGL